jgi:hypothetical protein
MGGDQSLRRGATGPGAYAVASGFRRLSFILFLFEFSQNSNGVTEVNDSSRFSQRVVDAKRGWSV